MDMLVVRVMAMQPSAGLGEARVSCVGEVVVDIAWLVDNMGYIDREGAKLQQWFALVPARVGDNVTSAEDVASNTKILLHLKLTPIGETRLMRREKLVVRNIHAHNCRGVLLSWAQLGKWGVGHVNNHRSQYLIDVFTGLGYRYNVNATEALHANRPKRAVRDQNVSQP